MHTGIGMHALKRGERNIKKKENGDRGRGGKRKEETHKRRGGGLPVDPGGHVVL